MTGAEALQRLKRELENNDQEAHANADTILCELLCDLGYDDVVEAWKKVPKWYA